MIFRALANPKTSVQTLESSERIQIHCLSSVNGIKLSLLLPRPYMSDGAMRTDDDVIACYVCGGRCDLCI